MARRRLKWAQSALKDLRGVLQFIGRNDPEMAREFGQRVRAQAQKTLNFPEGARRVPESEHPDCRELFIGNYRLIFLVQPENVVVVRFFHGARQIKRLLRQSGL